MIPSSYLSPEQAGQILSALGRGYGTTNSSAGTAADLGFNGWNVIPSLQGMPTDLVNRVLSSDLSSSTSVIDTTGLATASVTLLNGIRTRIIAAMTALYDDQGTPEQSPFYGLTAGTTAHNHARDAIVQMIFRFDSRYLLRKRSDTGAYAENYEYELQNAYQLTNHPLILARLRPHDIVNGTLDDTGTNGAYRVTTSSPHGYYSGQSMVSSSTGSSITQESLGLDRIEQNDPSSGLIADVTSKFVLDAGSVNHFINGQPVVTDGLVNNESGSAWTIMNWQPTRYVKRLSDTEFELYRDAALTDKIIPGWGSITGVHTGTYNGTDTVAVNTNGTHIIFDDVPQIFDTDSGSSVSLGIFERKSNLSVDPLTGVWSTGSSGFSFVDGQITNFASMGSAGWQNINDYVEPLYFKKLTETTFELYRDEALTTKFYPGNETGLVSSFTQSGGNWSVNFNASPGLVNGQSIRFSNTSTNFSNGLGISTFTPVTLTTPNLDYAGIAYSAGQFIAYGAANGGGTTNSYIYSTNGIDWTTGGWTGLQNIVDIAYNPTNNKSVALENGVTYVQVRTGTGSWSQVNKGSNTNAKRIVTFDLSGTPRFLVMPLYANSPWYYSETGASGSWVYYTPTRFAGLSYTMLDIAVGGTSGSDLVAVFWTGPSGNIATSKSTNGGQTWSAPVNLEATSSVLGQEVNMSYANGKYCVLTQDTAYYSTNGTTWTSVALSTSKQWHNIRNLNGVLYANAMDGSTSSIKSTDGGATWTTVTLTHGGIEYSAYYNGMHVGIKDPTGTPALVHSENAIDWANYADSTWTLSANHTLENGQPIRFNDGSGSTFTIDGYTCTVPRALWAKTTGLAANEFKLYQDEALTQSWTPWYGATIGAKSLTSIVYRMAFYAKRINATKFDLYVDSAMTNPYNQTISLTGFTTGDVYRTGHVLSMSPPSAGYMQPMFWCRTESYNSVTLWANSARTTPYPFFSTNGVLATGASGTTISISEVESGLDLSYVSYNTTGTYRINGIGFKMHLSDNTYALTGAIKPVYYAKKISSTVVELYIDANLSIPVKSGGTGPNAPAISSPITGTNYQITYFDTYRYRLDTINCYNIGGERYWYMDYSGGGSGVQKVNASWSATGYKFYTDHNTTNAIGTLPNVSVYEFDNSSAGSYYGMMRPTKGTGSTGTTGPAYANPAVYGGIGSPVIYELEFPGKFQYDSQFMFGISPVANVGTQVIDPLDRTGDEWVTDSNITEDRYLRQWPQHIMPATLTWSIEQPSQVLESQNSTRYTNSKDITQYRIKLSYAPMTMEQFRPFLNVITAAKGGFKPFKFYFPRNNKGNAVTINVNKRNLTVPGIVRARTTVNGGQQIIKIDGLPPNLNNAYSAGHALQLTRQNSLGSWLLPIHDVYTNEYGEANIRVNNSIAMKMYFGDLVLSDAVHLDCFLDSPTIDIKVDTLGYHYLEVDLVTKRIF